MSHGDGKPLAPAHVSQDKLQTGYVTDIYIYIYHGISIYVTAVKMFHPFSSHVNYHRVGQLEGQLGLGHAASPSVDVKAKLLGAAATR